MAATMVCETCGDQGFVEALVYCDSCKLRGVHRYCLGMTPVPIEEYITWFCAPCDDSDSDSDDSTQVVYTAQLRHILNKGDNNKKKKESKSIMLQDAINEVSSSPNKEAVNESKGRESSNSENPHELTYSEPNGTSVFETRNGASGSEKSKHGKKKQDAIDVEPLKVSSSTYKETESKGRKTHEESNCHTLSVTAVEVRSLQDLTNIKPATVSSSPITETAEESKRQEFSDSAKPHELTDLARNESLVLDKSRGKKKTNKESSGLDKLQHTASVEPVTVSSLAIKETSKECKKRESSDSKYSRELTGLVRSGVSVLETCVKKKKKNNNNDDERSNHTSGDQGLQDTINGELVKECKKRNRSDSGNSHEMTGAVRKRISVLETNVKKKKKKKTNKEKKNEESSNHTIAVLAAEDTINDKTLEVSSSPVSKRRESSGSGKLNESTGLVKHGASVSEGGISSSVPDYNSCTSKKRKLSSGDTQVTSENTQLAAGNSLCKKAESNMLHTNEGLTATFFDSLASNIDRALPIYKPIWRGSISVRHGSISGIDGLVAHLSSLACHEVHKKAGSLHVVLSAEMFPRLEIWPSRFLDKGQPTEESVALYFFPSSESGDETVYESLLCEMKKNDLAMRCELDNVDLLLFSSYQLPLNCWNFYSKEYLWGIFRRRKTSRQ